MQLSKTKGDYEIMNKNEKNYVENVLESYKEKGKTKIDELKALDKKAKLPANIFAYTFGIVGSLVLGFGMCIAMKVILKDLMILGIIIGLIGILMVSINYPIYQKILNNSKAKYKDQIKTLSNEILNEEN